MTLNEYQRLALRTENRNNICCGSDAFQRALKAYRIDCNEYGNTFICRLLEGTMGLSGESGEVLDIIKKYLFQGHDLDRRHIARELGDVAWYLSLAADAIGYSLEDICTMNIQKLWNRYPEGFEIEKSVNREKTDI